MGIKKLIRFMVGKKKEENKQIDNIEKTMSSMNNKVSSMEFKLKMILQELEEMKREYEDEMNQLKERYNIVPPSSLSLSNEENILNN
jgi:anion-transporting  ArsA/GET3 family ATPase